jgi:hypothetical protein
MLRDEQMAGIKALTDLGVAIESNLHLPDDMELTHLIRVSDDIKISVYFSREGYSFYLHRPIFDRPNIDWRVKEDILQKAGLVKPQRMHKPCLKRAKTIIAYWTKAYEILKKYYDERMQIRNSEIKEIEKLGGTRVSSHEYNDYVFRYMTKSKYFTLFYDFKDFTYTVKTLRYETHECYKQEAIMFEKFKSAGF